MKQVTIECPGCHKPHGVFWSVGKSGLKTLSYRCNRVERHGVENKYGLHDELRYVTSTLSVPDSLKPKELDGVPEEFTAIYKEELKEKNQTTFSL